MIVIDEATARQVVSLGDAIEAVRSSFVAADRGEAENYPVVREALGNRGAVFGVKAGVDRAQSILGLKAGGYWPENASRGVANHQSTTLLFDHESGQPAALVAAGYLTAVRTAAASALAAQALARPQSQVLAIIGAGTQAPFQIAAIRKLLPISTVLVANRSPGRAEALVAELCSDGVEARPEPIQAALAQADVIVTVTPSTTPLFDLSSVRAGTHISAMGSDTRGKQEIDPEVLRMAGVYTDSIEQCRTIGEGQHVTADIDAGRVVIGGTLGGLLTGRVPGRRTPEQITVFDGTGIALQDVAVAAVAVAAARRDGRAVEVSM